MIIITINFLKSHWKYGTMYTIKRKSEKVDTIKILNI